MHHLVAVMGLSERFACRVTGQHRTTQRHQPANATPADPERGVAAVAAGPCQSPSQVGSPPGLPRRPRRGLARQPQEAPAAVAARRAPGAATPPPLDRLAQDRGYPAVLHCDNGPELTCAEMADWTECASLIWPNLEASAGLVWPHPLDQSFPFTFGSAARAIAKRPGREGDPARCASQAPKCVRRRLKSGGSAGAVLGVLGSRMLRPTRRVRLAGRVPRRAELLPSGVAGMRDPLQSRQA